MGGLKSRPSSLNDVLKFWLLSSQLLWQSDSKALLYNSPLQTVKKHTLQLQAARQPLILFLLKDSLRPQELQGEESLMTFYTDVGVSEIMGSTSRVNKNMHIHIHTQVCSLRERWRVKQVSLLSTCFLFVPPPPLLPCCLWSSSGFLSLPCSLSRQAQKSVSFKLQLRRLDIQRGNSCHLHLHAARTTNFLWL